MPFRWVVPIGWTGVRYTTSKPMEEMRGRSSAAVRSVPDTQEPSGRWKAPSERGKISYHAPARASGRATPSG